MKESDWKQFRKRVPEWRERYLERINQELVTTLTREGKTPTERFWEAERRIEQEARTLVDCFDGHSRSKLTWFLFLMHGHGIIDNADLAEFSEELQQRMNFSLGTASHERSDE